jgi:hypothetical protein
MNLKKLFLKYCEDKKFEINQNQLDIIESSKDYYIENFKNLFLLNFLKKKK